MKRSFIEAFFICFHGIKKNQSVRGRTFYISIFWNGPNFFAVWLDKVLFQIPRVKYRPRFYRASCMRMQFFVNLMKYLLHWILQRLVQYFFSFNLSIPTAAKIVHKLLWMAYFMTCVVKSCIRVFCVELRQFLPRFVFACNNEASQFILSKDNIFQVPIVPQNSFYWGFLDLSSWLTKKAVSIMIGMTGHREITMCGIKALNGLDMKTYLGL